MEKRGSLFLGFLFFSLVTISTGQVKVIKNSETLTTCPVPENSSPKGHSPKLFVFGDSYVDTGNLQPFRSSGGCVLTDYIASFLGINSPVQYEKRNLAENKAELKNGMNFAYGGSGVLKEAWNNHSMTVQINNFKQQIKEKVFTKYDLENSAALVSHAGNDYTYLYLNQSGTIKDVHDLAGRVVDQLVKNVKEIHELGVKKIAILGSPPRGCWPQLNPRPRTNCNATWNEESRFHNQLLTEALKNVESKKNAFVFLDLYKAMDLALQKNKENSNYENPLEPCCDGVRDEYWCGMKDQKGAEMFTVCRQPESSFFWDKVHPSQNGVHAIFLDLIPSLERLLLIC
ncbi:hypothetical protein Peur_012610 [Populus x canadensis]